MKILITGATGYIGRYLAKVLIKKGHKIKVLARENSNILMLKKLGAEVVCGDLLKKDTLKGITENVDMVFHLAGDVYPKKSPYYFYINVLGTSYLLRECKKNRVQKFIYLSSTAVYGPSRGRGECLDEHSECHPQSYYARTKLKAEKIVMSYHRNHGVQAVILRPSIVYGTGLYPFSLGSIMTYLIKNRLFFIIGRGNNFLPLCNISNLINAMVLIVDSKQCVGEIFNISDEVNYTLAEISQKIADYYKVKIPSIHISKLIAKSLVPFMFLYAKAHNLEIQVNFGIVNELAGNWPVTIGKAVSVLGYKPEITLDVGIKKHLQRFVFNNE